MRRKSRQVQRGWRSGLRVDAWRHALPSPRVSGSPTSLLTESGPLSTHIGSVAVLMVDPPHGEPGVQLVPGRALVGVNQGALVDPLSDRRHGGLLRRAHLRQRPAVALAHHHDNLTFARLVLGKPPVHPIGSHVFRPDVTTKVGAIDLGNSSLTAET